MTGDSLASTSPEPSGAACYVFAYLHRRGGSQRLGPLLRGLGMNERAFVDAVTELAERYWISVVWHKAEPATPDDEPRPLRDVYRLCTTRFGRQKYRATWPEY
jgi:hypothetical protein